MSYTHLDPAELEQVLSFEGITIIDQRDPQARAAGMLDGAVPPDDAVVRSLLRRKHENPAVVVYCYHGNMSQELCAFLAGMGLTRVFNLAGGWAALEAWRNTAT